MTDYIKKRKFLLLFVLILVCIRIWLPYYLKDKLVASINSVDGYSCTLKDLDLSIIRGAMVLEGLEILITDNQVDKPYVAIEEADISIEWSAIIKGAIVGEIYLNEPIVHFSDGEEDDQEQAGDVSWAKPILDFIPLRINRFEIVNGKVEFENKQSTPPVQLTVSDISLLATNLTNAKNQQNDLPSKVALSSTVFGKGDLQITGQMNIIKEIPDMDLDIQATNVDLTSLNDFTKAYAAFDFESGMFSFASELAMKDGEILGYGKPILEDVSVFKLKEEGSLLNKFWQSFVGFAIEITENQLNDQSATKVPLTGQYDDPNVNIVITILNVFRNAFIKAYDKQTDNSINFNDLKQKISDGNLFEDKLNLFDQ